MHESCGKCTPCREGTRWLVQLLEKIEAGDGTDADLDLYVVDVCDGSKEVALRSATLPSGASAATRRSSARSSRPTSTSDAALRRRVVHRRRPSPLAISTLTAMAEVLHELGRVGQGHRRRGRCGCRRARVWSRPPPRPSRSRSSVTGAPGTADRRLPHVLVEVEGMPKLQAGCTATATDGDRGRGGVGEGGGRAGRHARVHPRQPPARLSDLRQGRRVPAPGSDVPVGPGQHADAVRQAHRGQADSHQSADRARPRALHPLLPLHALLRGRRRGRAARRQEPRRVVGDRDLRGRAVPRALQRQRDRAVPGRRADLDDVQVRGAAVEIQNVPTVCGMCPVGCNISATTREGASAGSSRAIPRSTAAGCARRAVSPTGTFRRRIASSIRSAAAAALRGARLGRGAGRGRAAAPWRGEPDRHRALRDRRQSTGLCARQVAPPGPWRALGRPSGGGRQLAGCLPRAAVCDRRGRCRRESSETSPSASGRRSSTSGSSSRAETAPKSCTASTRHESARLGRRC